MVLLRPARYIALTGMSDVTHILHAMERGDAAAAEQLLPLVYDELRVLAQQRMAQEHAGHTLQATALVHEAYLRLVHNTDEHVASWDSTGHFFAAAAEAMRRILIDHARARNTVKRGSGVRPMSLDATAHADIPPADLLDLDEALRKFEREDESGAALIKLRFFAGLSLQQAAQLLDMSRATAYRRWTYARAWLFHEIHGDAPEHAQQR